MTCGDALSWPLDGLHMTCDRCRWKAERRECPWDYDYEGTDYAEDCCDFRNVDSPQDAFIAE